MIIPTSIKVINPEQEICIKKSPTLNGKILIKIEIRFTHIQTNK